MGHIAIGLAAGRAYGPRAAPRGQLVKTMLAFAALSMAPDADVISFGLGIPYEAPFGHRGATHSIGAALLVAMIARLISRPLKLPPLRTSVTAGLVVLSHALLDTLTNGGLGCALLWPLSNQRFFAPVTPIPVAPIGLYMFSLRGALVLAVETLMFLPVFIYATFPRVTRAPPAAP